MFCREFSGNPVTPHHQDGIKNMRWSLPISRPPIKRVVDGSMTSLGVVQQHPDPQDPDLPEEQWSARELRRRSHPKQHSPGWNHPQVG